MKGVKAVVWPGTAALSEAAKGTARALGHVRHDGKSIERRAKAGGCKGTMPLAQDAFSGLLDHVVVLSLTTDRRLSASRSLPGSPRYSAQTKTPSPVLSGRVRLWWVRGQDLNL